MMIFMVSRPVLPVLSLYKKRLLSLQLLQGQIIAAAIASASVVVSQLRPIPEKELRAAANCSMTICMLRG
jgi:hypothetical protein